MSEMRVFYNGFSERFIPEEDFRARYEERCEEAAEQVAEFRKADADFRYTEISFEQYLMDVLEEKELCEVTKLANCDNPDFTEQEIKDLLNGKEVYKEDELFIFCYKLVEEEYSEGHYNLHSCHIGRDWTDWEDLKWEESNTEFTQEEILKMLQKQEVFRAQENVKYRIIPVRDGDPQTQIAFPKHSGHVWTEWEEEITFAAIWR